MRPIYKINEDITITALDDRNWAIYKRIEKKELQEGEEKKKGKALYQTTKYSGITVL